MQHSYIIPGTTDCTESIIAKIQEYYPHIRILRVDGPLFRFNGRMWEIHTRKISPNDISLSCLSEFTHIAVYQAYTIQISDDAGNIRKDLLIRFADISNP